MRRLRQSGLRSRLIAAVILTALPLMGWIWYTAQTEFAKESAALEDEVQRLTAFITADVNRILESTRQMLSGIARMAQAGGAEHVGSVVKDLTGPESYYRQIGVVFPEGGDRGAGDAAADASGPIEETLVRRALESDSIVVGRSGGRLPGEYGPLTVVSRGQSGHGVGSPVVAFAVMRPGWLNSLLAESRVVGARSLFPHDMILNIVDNSGAILTRYPDKERWIGRKLPDTDVLDAILRQGEGSAELAGVDGVLRYYAFQSVRAASGGILVCTGVSKQSALGSLRRTTYLTLAGVSVVSLLLILAAWLGTERFVTRPVTALVAVTERLGGGDLSARVGAIRGPREISHLAASFDRMSETLEKTVREQKAMQARLVEYDRQLRSMTVEAAMAEEEERKHIAAGLHDKAGPLLAACYMKLGRAMKTPAPEPVAAAVRESRDLIDQATAELRSLTFDLSSPTLYALGLAPAVEALCRDTAGHHNLRIDFEDRGTPADLSNDRRVVLYRAARELLLNVVKHAEATQAKVTCGGDAEGVFVSVVDDGVGFDADDAGRGFSRTGGFGLFTLRERVEHLGGRFAILSSRGAGTRVTVVLPGQFRDSGEEQHDDDRHLSG